MSAVVVTLDLSTNPIGWGEYERAEMIRSLRAEKSLTGAWLADQIEAQTKPPKPAEPTARYAVVVDAEGSEWVRDGLDSDRAHSGPWWNATSARESSGNARRAEYAEIDAVRVLSEGIQ